MPNAGTDHPNDRHTSLAIIDRTVVESTSQPPRRHERGDAMTTSDVEIHDEQPLLRTKIFTIREATLRYRKFGADRTISGDWSDTLKRVCVDRGDSVAAVVVNVDTDQLIMVEQFRYPTVRHGSGWIVELVAGMVDGDEDPSEAMRREIREEIGYDVRTLEKITTMYLSPGGSSERVTLFYTEVDASLRIGDGGGLAEESEDIALRTVSRHDVADMIEKGAVEDAKTLAGLLWLQQRPR